MWPRLGFGVALGVCLGWLVIFWIHVIAALVRCANGAAPF